jgi:hypothetical protein
MGWLPRFYYTLNPWGWDLKSGIGAPLLSMLRQGMGAAITINLFYNCRAVCFSGSHFSHLIHLLDKTID